MSTAAMWNSSDYSFRQRRKEKECMLSPRNHQSLKVKIAHFHTSRPHRASSSSSTVDYLLADVGEGITECEIVKWFVEPGANVEEFDVLVEVQSDKASVEITSRYAGRLVEHCYKVGEVAKVGQPLCRIEVQKSEDVASESQSIASAEMEEAKSETVDDAPTSSSGTSAPPMPNPGRDEDSVPSRFPSSGPILATPAVRRIIREHNIDIERIVGTGKAGRVTKEDVQDFIVSQPSETDVASKSVSSTSPSHSITPKVTPLSGTRKAMYKAMCTTWTIPHFGYSDEIDITKVDSLRKEMQTSVDRDYGIKLTLLPFLLKALSMALYRHPLFCSTLDQNSMSLQEYEQHRLSIALSSPRGLLTPTLPLDVRQSSIVDIAEQVQSLQRISTERGLTPRETGGGATMTLSNIGSIGGLYTFPLIPPTGQLIIGAVGRSRLTPRFNDKGDIIKALLLPVSFSADHRVVEGVELARFVQDWKELLENPSSWLLRMR